MSVKTKDEIVEKIKEVIGGTKIAAMATIKDGKPWARFMATEFPDDGTLDLYSSTSVESRKVHQLKDDDHIHLTISEDVSNFNAPYIQYAGRAEVICDEKTKQKHWKEHYSNYFRGPDDPHFCVLRFKPEKIELMGVGLNPWEPKVWTK